MDGRAFGILETKNLRALSIFIINLGRIIAIRKIN